MKKATQDRQRIIDEKNNAVSQLQLQSEGVVKKYTALATLYTQLRSEHLTLLRRVQNSILVPKPHPDVGSLPTNTTFVPGNNGLSTTRLSEEALMSGSSNSEVIHGNSAPPFAMPASPIPGNAFPPLDEMAPNRPLLNPAAEFQGTFGQVDNAGLSGLEAIEGAQASIYPRVNNTFSTGNETGVISHELTLPMVFLTMVMLCGAMLPLSF